ncbi:LPXTG cell wall anchor domain-containing protein [Bacillus alkalisoli]|uniref:LPXTG cell wall anchor domain-containing protein n=1 Tax=Bacillus alkalisoli TaxID=2011008 RepID=UPI000C249395|nr:LPXTG cell wall anchor domain-containing protein [Bacillus alkalisoli]
MKIKYLLVLIISTVFFIIYTPIFQTGATDSEKVLIIETFPSSTFINLGGLKPGDQIIKPLEVLNKGNIGFSYSTFVEFNGGSQKYYNALELTVLDSDNNMFFDGKVQDFQGLSDRKVSIFSKEKLLFKFSVPHELGNEYQGLSTGLNLIFVAEEEYKDEPTIPVDSTNPGGSTLPDTATNSFNYMLLGLGLFVIGTLLVIRLRFKLNKIRS